MRAGAYNELIYIYKPVVTTSATGSSVTSWDLLFTTRAAVQYQSGSRAVVNESEVFYDRSFKLIVHSYVPVQDFHQIKWHDKMYRIISIERRRDYNDIEILVERVNE